MRLKTINKRIFLFVCIILIVIGLIQAQTAKKDVLKKGFNFIKTHVYSEKEDAEVLKIYEGLRVADVSDGMDKVGLSDSGLVDPAILPLWKDQKGLSHQVRGIAITIRYVPTQRRKRPGPNEDFDKWVGNWYWKYSSEVWIELIRPGNIIVIDDAETADCGSIGSFNILDWYMRGAVGVVTDASSRDTDEVILEKVPLYLRRRGRGIRPGRNELESVNRPVVIGGVLVCPGDVVVADGDGVIVVPRAAAKEVAKYARKILTKDKAARKDLYKRMKMKSDRTIE